MIPITPGSKTNSTEEHARRLAAFEGLRKMYVEFKAQFELTDRLDHVVDLFLGVIVLIVGLIFFAFSFWFFGGKLIYETVSLAITVRYLSFLLALATLGVVIFSGGIWILKAPFPVHPYFVFLYGLPVIFFSALFGAAGVIPIALLFP